MSAATVLTPAEVLADLIAEGVRRRQGAVGVLVRDVPAPDPNRLLRALAELRDEGIDLRIAYLREGGLAAAREAGFNDENFSTQVERAEVWRNQRDLAALIVVIAHGDEAKLSSLEDFSAITSRELKAILVRRALGEEAGQNEVQARWWQMLDEDDSIGLGTADRLLHRARRKDGSGLPRRVQPRDQPPRAVARPRVLQRPP